MNATSLEADAAAFCAALVRSHDFDRYASTLFVAPARRRALLALYAFNVEIVRVRDQVTQPLPGEIRLQWWTDLLAGTAHGGAEGNPVAAELLGMIATYGLPVEPLERLIEAHQFDLYNDPMPDLAALQDYLDATVGSLMGLATTVLGATAGPIAHLAHHAGVAIGIAQLMAALPRDASRRQLFLPLDILTGQGSGLEEVFAGKPTPALSASLAQFAAEARDHLDLAEALLAEASTETRPAFLTLALARRDLDRTTRAAQNPFVPSPRSPLATLWTLWRASRSRLFRG